MFFIGVFLLAWTVFFFLVQRGKFKECYPCALGGMVMSLASDVVTQYYPFWGYLDKDTHLHPLLIQLLDDFGIYPVIGYLYVQFLPQLGSRWLLYTFLWSAGGIATEYGMSEAGYIVHDLGWNLGWSYLADWIIFGTLTLHQRYRAQQTQASSFVTIAPSGKALISFEHQIVRVDNPMLLLKHGVSVYKGTSNDNVQTFLSMLEPEGSMPPHEHSGYEIHYLIDGNVSFEVGAGEALMKSGDILFIPPSTVHSAKNLGPIQAQFITLVVQEQTGLAEHIG